MLLVFAVNDELGWPDDDDDQLCFEWYASGTTEGLVCAEDLPAPAWRFVTCYGVRCRTVDYVAEDAARVLGESLGYREGGDEWYSLGSIARLAGMKIGGAPLCLDAKHREAMLPGTFLCSLASIVPRPESPYPWVNHPSPIGFSEFYRDENKLDFRDGFLLNLWLDQRMSITWSLQFW
jgi:hypothetical protein